MGSYKPFFVRQRATMHKGSVAKQVTDPATLLPSVAPTAAAPEYDNPGYQTASLSTADGAQEIEQGQQEGDVGTNATDFANSISGTPQKFGRKFASHPAKTKSVLEEAPKQEVEPELKKQKVEEEMSNKRNWLKEQAALKAKQEEEAAAKAAKPTPKPEPKKAVAKQKKEAKPKTPETSKATPRRKKTKPSDD